MENLEVVRAAIMAELEKEVTRFLAKVAQEKPGGLQLERAAREVGLRCGAQVLEKGLALYGKGNQGRSLPCQCPEPGMKFVRYDRVRITSVTGEIEVVSAYYHCSVCGQSRWPVLEQFGSVGGLSEGARRMAAEAGGLIGGFEQSGEVLYRFSGLRLSDNTIRRVTEQVGQGLREQEKKAVAQAWETHEPVRAAKAVECLHVAVDGTTVCTEKGAWREVKSGVIYETKAVPGEEPQAVRPSYVSTFDPAREFGHEVWLQAARRGASQAKRIVTLGDGSVWIWNLYAENFPFNRVEVLDYFHASEHLAELARACWGEATKQAQRWHAQHAKTLLKKNGAARVRQVMKELTVTDPKARAVIDATISYFEHNLTRMNYYEYRKQGYHIGSGLAEAACKHVVGARFKQSGMTNWTIPGAEAVLRVRVAIKNGTFERQCDALASQRFQKAA